MEHTEESLVLGELQRGDTSRNREFERFARPRARRALRAHRRLCSLLAEMEQTDVRVTARWIQDGRTLDVECRRPGLRYRRQLLLPRWEAEFLLQTPAGVGLVPRSSAPA